MSLPRRTRTLVALMSVALALCVWPPLAAAHDGPGVAVTPAKSSWMAESWAQIYSLPVSENPFAGNGDNCLVLAHHVLQAIGSRPCTIERGWTYTLGFGSAWSSVEDPFPTTEVEQRALAIAGDQALFLSITLTVDNGPP